MNRYSFTIGLIYRRAFRRLLINSNIEFREDKGWLDSLFSVTTTPEIYRRIQNLLIEWSKE